MTTKKILEHIHQLSHTIGSRHLKVDVVYIHSFFKLYVYGYLSTNPTQNGKQNPCLTALFRLPFIKPDMARGIHSRVKEKNNDGDTKAFVV